MKLQTRARIAGVLALSLLPLSAGNSLAGITFPKPDAEIRSGSDPDVGGNIYNTTATRQVVMGAGAVGQKLTFWISIGNDDHGIDSFKVKRSSGFRSGYRVRYLNAEGVDVTGKVNAGTFMTPLLAIGQEYVMRATVLVLPLATEGSSTARLITVSSVTYPALKDSVRFIAARDFPSTAHLTLDPGDVVGTDDYQYQYQSGEINGTATFTLENDGSGPSSVLLVSLSGTGLFQLANDTCTGSSVAASGTCSFQVNYFAPTDCVTLFIGDVNVFGGSDAYLHLKLVAICDLI